jgi:hypothetical protein
MPAAASWLFFHPSSVLPARQQRRQQRSQPDHPLPAGLRQRYLHCRHARQPTDRHSASRRAGAHGAQPGSRPATAAAPHPAERPAVHSQAQPSTWPVSQGPAGEGDKARVKPATGPHPAQAGKRAPKAPGLMEASQRGRPPQPAHTGGPPGQRAPANPPTNRPEMNRACQHRRRPAQATSSPKGTRRAGHAAPGVRWEGLGAPP